MCSINLSLLAIMSQEAQKYHNSLPKGEAKRYMLVDFLYEDAFVKRKSILARVPPGTRGSNRKKLLIKSIHECFHEFKCDVELALNTTILEGYLEYPVRRV